MTEKDAEDIAILIDNDVALSKLRVTLKVKEADTVGSLDVFDKALAVINKWRQSSNHSCVSILRDALHKVGLQEVDRTVFGHIQDWTLSKPEGGTATLVLPDIPHSDAKSSATAR